MKAIIPVAGAGTKLRPHSYTQPKALIPLAGKTILGIIIENSKLPVSRILFLLLDILVKKLRILFNKVIQH